MALFVFRLRSLLTARIDNHTEMGSTDRGQGKKETMKRREKKASLWLETPQGTKIKEEKLLVRRMEGTKEVPERHIRLPGQRDVNIYNILGK